MFVIYSYTNSGAGDVKLAAGIGAFLGVKGGLLTICYAYIAAACFAGCLMIWLFGFGFAARGVMRFSQIWHAPENPEIEARAKTIMSKGLPLAPFFLIGTLLTLFDLLRFFQAY
jgi:prepilin signal peptidase PulO-like enzyme (type II secretory pathway)